MCVGVYIYELVSVCSLSDGHGRVSVPTPSYRQTSHRHGTVAAGMRKCQKRPIYTANETC